MRTILRYKNRKLYDASLSAYITMDDVAVFIRQGQEVSIVDKATGRDVTVSSLTRYILDSFDQEYMYAPLPILTNIIKTGTGFIPVNSLRSSND